MTKMKYFPWMAACAALCIGGLAQAQQAVPAGQPALSTETAPKPPVAGVASPASAAPVADPHAIRVLLSPELETVLAAQMLGQVANVHVGLGEKVGKGKTLLSFDCSEANARLRIAQAEYANAKETLDAKERLRKLDAAGDTEVMLAKTMADKAKAAINLSQVQTGQCVVKAPFAGHVVKLHVKPAQGVNVGVPLLEMVSDGPLKLRLNVPSRWLHALKVGTAFEVAIDETRKTYPAKVTAINARVDAIAQTVELEAHIEGQHAELLAGMSGVARFPDAVQQ